MSLAVPQNIPNHPSDRCSPDAVQGSCCHVGMMEISAITPWELTACPQYWSLSLYRKGEEFQWSDGWLWLVDYFWFGGHLNYLVLTLPVLIIPLSFSNPCVTRRKNCKHVRLLFSANSLSNQCQTRLCLKTSLAPTQEKEIGLHFL